MRIVRNLLLILLVVLLLPYLVTPFYRAGHPVSTLMAWRWLKGAPVSRQWIDFKAMSPSLPRSVVGSEDAKFCSHRGVDWDALREAIDDAEDGEVSGGGSTITQQVAKNLFLWPGRSVVRKALELPLALWIDLVLPKQRMLEIYLNIAELGPSGQFGAEAGSNYAFGHSAATLSPREAALLAAILPNPVRRSARNPGPGVRRLAGTYMARAQCRGVAALLERKSRILSQFSAVLTAADPSFTPVPSSISAALSASQPVLLSAGLSASRTMPPTTPLEDRYGRSQKKNIAVAPWHAPLGGRAEEADLCRGQGFRRTAPSAPPRPEDRHVQGPAGSEGQEES